VKFHFTNSETKRKSIFLQKRYQQNIKFRIPGGPIPPFRRPWLWNGNAYDSLSRRKTASRARTKTWTTKWRDSMLTWPMTTAPRPAHIRKRISPPLPPRKTSASAKLASRQRRAPRFQIAPPTTTIWRTTNSSRQSKIMTTFPARGVRPRSAPNGRARTTTTP